MRSRKGNTPESAQLLLCRLCTTLVLVALFPLPLWSQSTLENPAPGSFQSGRGQPGHADYCRDYGPCGIGDGDCDPGQCATGLVCVTDVGAQYGLPAHYDVCEAGGSQPDPNYCVSNSCGIGDGDCDPGQCATGLVCATDVGAQYDLPAHYDVCEAGGARPDPNYCVSNSCGIGDGDCDPGQCATGLVCATDVGAQYGLPAHYDVCEAGGASPAALVRQGEGMLASGNLHNANEHFRQAVELDLNNPQANLYSAITRIVTPILANPVLMSLANRSGVVTTGDSSDVCAMRVTLPEQVPSSAPRTGEIIQTFREALLPEIVAAVENLNRIASTAEIRFDLMNLPDCLRSRVEDVGIEQAEVEIDRSDIQALTAALQLAQAAFEIAAAYDLDADLRLVTTQTSRDILDAEPGLLDLISSASLTTAQNLVEQALMKAGAAIESVLAETDDQSDDVIEVLPKDASDARLVQDTLESVRQSLRGIVTLPTDIGLDDPERLNLSLLFSGRFRTLRPFIPVFDSGCRTISIPTTLRGSLTAADVESLFQGRTGIGGTFFPLGRFPDPTFGGTTPDLTQRDINNQLLKGEPYYADCYAFSGTAGQSVSLRVQSPAFDTVLVLIGPDGRIAHDNDDCFGDSPNSCLPYDTLEGGRLTLPSSGSYTVEVSSYFAEEGGDYTLTVDEP